MLKLQQNFF